MSSTSTGTSTFTGTTSTTFSESSSSTTTTAFESASATSISISTSMSTPGTSISTTSMTLSSMVTGTSTTNAARSKHNETANHLATAAQESISPSSRPSDDDEPGGLGARFWLFMVGLFIAFSSLAYVVRSGRFRSSQELPWMQQQREVGLQRQLEPLSTFGMGVDADDEIIGGPLAGRRLGNSGNWNPSRGIGSSHFDGSYATLSTPR
eukprot:gnl/MRDRNA2_/MRDRNA2_18645_c0_seq1.p1 gnl/MRDRNA2_/MRDRNA2_18645_c0~~gnl/MRDRNA2_/MRDRNA2_18645_c0_seq1.p1  ORF type:complete len:216 (-),score=30.64 gnl/MRDRNA2_/MRDRNA2_18645_c0_seq1:95-721(-)